MPAAGFSSQQLLTLSELTQGHILIGTLPTAQLGNHHVATHVRSAPQPLPPAQALATTQPRDYASNQPPQSIRLNPSTRLYQAVNQPAAAPAGHFPARKNRVFIREGATALLHNTLAPAGHTAHSEHCSRAWHSPPGVVN